MLNWNDELLGVKITPENWVGGLIEFDGKWGDAADIVHDGEPTWDTYDFIQYPELRRRWQIENTLPIFPPRGWANRTDAELMNAVTGHPERGSSTSTFMPVILEDHGDDANGKSRHCFWAAIEQSGNVFLHLDGKGGQYVATVTPALTLALQNAQVLARRLKGDQP